MVDDENSCFTDDNDSPCNANSIQRHPKIAGWNRHQSPFSQALDNVSNILTEITEMKTSLR